MSKLSLLSQVPSLIYNLIERKKHSSIDQMKTVANERYNTPTLHHSIKHIIVKINNT